MIFCLSLFKHAELHTYVGTVPELYSMCSMALHLIYLVNSTPLAHQLASF